MGFRSANSRPTSTLNQPYLTATPFDQNHYRRVVSVILFSKAANIPSPNHRQHDGHDQHGPELHPETSDTITPIPTNIENETPQTTPELLKGKGRNRQRLLRGIQRLSPSPSFTNLRRARSHSAPYRSSTRGNLSCVSLAATGPPTPAAGTSGTPVSSPLGLQTATSSRF